MNENSRSVPIKETYGFVRGERERERERGEATLGISLIVFCSHKK